MLHDDRFFLLLSWSVVSCQLANNVKTELNKVIDARGGIVTTSEHWQLVLTSVIELPTFFAAMYALSSG